MKKILLVFGTRPEAIKMCPLVKEFQKHPNDFETIVCVTGQHREMLDQVLRIFEVTPDYDLNIMKQGQDLYDVTARVLTGMRDVLKEVRPFFACKALVINCRFPAKWLFQVSSIIQRSRPLNHNSNGFSLFRKYPNSWC